MYSTRGSVHTFSNPPDRQARALVILTSDIGAQYFRYVAEVANLPGGPSLARMVEAVTMPYRRMWVYGANQIVLSLNERISYPRYIEN
jgi:hypothetical protein